MMMSSYIGYRNLLVGFVVAVNLTGCARQFKSVADVPYLLNLKKDQLCIEGTSQCTSLNMIVPSYRGNLVAKSYGLKPGHYSFNSESLAQLMLNPPEQLYRVEMVSEDLYRLPSVRPVHTVWDYLVLEYYELYERDDSLGSGFLMAPPASRRYFH